MRASVLHWNRPGECLATVAALQAGGLPLAITVVDNGSSAENRRALAAGLPAGVELIELPVNRGWGAAHNVVLRRWLAEETSPYCLVAAHDARPQGDCLARLAAALDAQPARGVVCPQYGTAEVPRYSVLRGARLRPVSPRPAGTVEDVDYAHGTLAVFRRECLAAIGVFDERYFVYGDETEIGLRARARGWRIGLVWDAVLVNAEPGPNPAAIAYYWTRSTLRLARAFGGRPGLLGRTALVLAVTAREWLKRTPAHDLSSPRARWRGVIDYYRGRTGGREATAPARQDA